MHQIPYLCCNTSINMISFPHAKINLGLHVTRKRDDGYHDIETVLYPIPLTDVLEMVPAANGNFQFTQSGYFTGETEDNICVKAYALYQQQQPFSHQSVFLHKAIPHGAGLGGGSSDATYVFRMLHKIFPIVADKGSLSVMAGILGSDCPFFLQNKPAFATGRGDQFKAVDVDLKGYSLLLVKPDQGISTAEAYSMIKPQNAPTSIEKVVSQDVSAWKDALYNDFEDVAFSMCPELQQIKQMLYSAGAIYASMTGSGSCMYGLFHGDEIPVIQEFAGYYTAKLQL